MVKNTKQTIRELVATSSFKNFASHVIKPTLGTKLEDELPSLQRIILSTSSDIDEELSVSDVGGILQFFIGDQALVIGSFAEEKLALDRALEIIAGVDLVKSEKSKIVFNYNNGENLSSILIDVENGEIIFIDPTEGEELQEKFRQFRQNFNATLLPILKTKFPSLNWIYQDPRNLALVQDVEEPLCSILNTVNVLCFEEDAQLLRLKLAEIIGCDITTIPQDYVEIRHFVTEFLENDKNKQEVLNRVKSAEYIRKSVIKHYPQPDVSRNITDNNYQKIITEIKESRVEKLRKRKQEIHQVIDDLEKLRLGTYEDDQQKLLNNAADYIVSCGFSSLTMASQKAETSLEDERSDSGSIAHSRHLAARENLDFVCKEFPEQGIHYLQQELTTEKLKEESFQKYIELLNKRLEELGNITDKDLPKLHSLLLNAEAQLALEVQYYDTILIAAQSLTRYSHEANRSAQSRIEAWKHQLALTPDLTLIDSEKYFRGETQSFAKDEAHALAKLSNMMSEMGSEMPLEMMPEMMRIKNFIDSQDGRQFRLFAERKQELERFVQEKKINSPEVEQIKLGNYIIKIEENDKFRIFQGQKEIIIDGLPYTTHNEILRPFSLREMDDLISEARKYLEEKDLNAELKSRLLWMEGSLVIGNEDAYGKEFIFYDLRGKRNVFIIDDEGYVKILGEEISEEEISEEESGSYRALSLEELRFFNSCLSSLSSRAVFDGLNQPENINVLRLDEAYIVSSKGEEKGVAFYNLSKKLADDELQPIGQIRYHVDSAKIEFLYPDQQPAEIFVDATAMVKERFFVNTNLLQSNIGKDTEEISGDYKFSPPLAYGSKRAVEDLERTRDDGNQAKIISSNFELKASMFEDGNEYSSSGLKKGEDKRVKITPSDFSLGEKVQEFVFEPGKEKRDTRYNYARFVGLHFDETERKPNQPSILQNNDLFMASFVGCKISGVDFSEVENLESVKFLKCEFDNCIFPKGFKFKEENLHGIKITESSDRIVLPLPGKNGPIRGEQTPVPVLAATNAIQATRGLSTAAATPAARSYS